MSLGRLFNLPDRPFLIGEMELMILLIKAVINIRCLERHLAYGTHSNGNYHQCHLYLRRAGYLSVVRNAWLHTQAELVNKSGEMFPSFKKPFVGAPWGPYIGYGCHWCLRRKYRGGLFFVCACSCLWAACICGIYVCLYLFVYICL